MSGGILDSFQTIIPTAAAVLSERRQILRMTQQKVADRANITLRQYQACRCKLFGIDLSILLFFGIMPSFKLMFSPVTKSFAFNRFQFFKVIVTMIEFRNINLNDGMMPKKSNMDKSMPKSLHLQA